ncbi:hypothetical protein SANT12839_016910 [Streptomyces antimycoticus]|uniref:Uncharacterized protein n=1 Tax=Streptomyces antimycoticus TaxID=68175 RepID=A0A4D4K3E1_9ACTN|nr:hypothetical protein SANT12839_016910 [Streptomyces antimycoticus]
MVRTAVVLDAAACSATEREEQEIGADTPEGEHRPGGKQPFVRLDGVAHDMAQIGGQLVRAGPGAHGPPLPVRRFPAVRGVKAREDGVSAFGPYHRRAPVLVGREAQRHVTEEEVPVGIGQPLPFALERSHLVTATGNGRHKRSPRRSSTDHTAGMGS